MAIPRALLLDESSGKLPARAPEVVYSYTRRSSASTIQTDEPSVAMPVPSLLSGVRLKPPMLAPVREYS